MAKKIYIINPSSYPPHYLGVDFFNHYGLSKRSYAMDLTSATIVAMAKQFFDVEFCDELIQSINFDTDADIIGITGMFTQWERMRVISEKFRDKGKIVMMGGPHVTLCPEMVRPYCDILVTGEIEDIYQDLFNDIRKDKWKDKYQGTRTDFSTSVAPDLSIYPHHLVQMGSLQTSRGCPFECEFCEAIQYLGRKQRYKPVDTIISELHMLVDHGYTDIFLTDDNFTANREKAKEILLAFKRWNEQRGNKRVGFAAQMSIDVANDSEMMDLMATASIDAAFLGIETPNTASLKSAGKKQNLNVDISKQTRIFLDYGVSVLAGIIVGFDEDTLSIFESIRDFTQSLPVPIYHIGILVATFATPLYKRLKEEERLLSDDLIYKAYPFDTNFIPKNMSKEELVVGTKWLCSNIYHPKMYEERIHMFLDQYNWESRPWFINEHIESYGQQNPHQEQFINECLTVFDIISKLGEPEAKLVENILNRAFTEPRTSIYAFFLLLRYAQIRYMFDLSNFYDGSLYNRPVFDKMN